MILLADSKGPDQTARKRRLIWAFALRICPKTRFRTVRPIESRLLVRLYNIYENIQEMSQS